MHNHYHNVNTSDRFADLIDTLLDWKRGAAAIDIETTGLDPWADGAAVVSISITATDEETWVVPLDHPEGAWGHEWQHRLGEIMDAMRGVPVVAHNANFDLGWLRRFIPDVHLVLHHDTQTWAHLQNENQSKRLKELANPLMEGQWAIDVRDCKRVPWFTLATYNAYDTIATMRLYKQQVGAGTTSLRVHLLHDRTVHPAQEALIEMEHRGLWLDRDEAKDRLVREEAARDEAAGWLMSAAMLYRMDPEDFPTVSWEPTSKWFLAFTEYAVEDGGLEVQEMTPAGRPSWRGGVLERQARAGSEVAQTLLDYRDAAKKAQFISSWLDVADANGRVHGRYNIARARTGRLTSSDPNMQQIARDLKPLWGAGPDDDLVEIDYSQIEMRVAAELIHRTVLPDNPLLMAFRYGQDIHTMNGARVDIDTTMEAARLLLVRAGLPADGTGAEVLCALRDGAITGEEPAGLLQIRGQDRAHQAARDREWWGPEKGEEPELEGWSLSAAVGEAPEGRLREMWRDLLVWGEDAGRTSRGRGPDEQRPLEPHHALSLVSRAGRRTLESLQPDVNWGYIRQAGKAIGFGFLFGMGAAKFVQYADEVYGVSFTLEEAERVREGYFNLWDGLEDWHIYTMRTARKQGYVQNPYYRRRHLPELFGSDPYDVSQAERQAINSMVQGTASDMMLEALGRFERKHPGYLLGTVHDSVLLIDRDDMAEEMCAIMTNPSIDLEVPIEVEASIGPRWGTYDRTFVRSN